MREEAFGAWLRSLDFEYWSTGQHKISPQEFFEKWARGEAVLLDVRSDQEIRYVSLPFALHVPIDQLPDRLNEIPRDKLVAIFCSGSQRASVAFAYLQLKGFTNVRIFKGGYAELMSGLTPGALRRWIKSG